MPKSILFIISHSIKTGPSQRFRIGLYLPHLEKAGFRYKIRSFYSPEGGRIIAQKGGALRKAGVVIAGYIKRLYTVLFEAWNYDYIFIQREAAPFGPPVFEWLLCRLLRKKIIFDFDDAVWLIHRTNPGPLYNLLKAPWKTAHICRWSYKIAAGNDFLYDFAKKYNSSVFKIPTCVDTETRHNQVKDHVPRQKITIGWTGSHTTIQYLQPIAKVISALQQEKNIDFLVICNQPANEIIPGAQFVQWSEATEAADLLRMDIGVMPLVDNEWTRGKCGFKLIQYMSVGLPVVASKVGMNEEIVSDGKEGFICESEADWKNALCRLIEDPDLRNQMGTAGRMKMVHHYSITSQKEKFISLFD